MKIIPETFRSVTASPNEVGDFHAELINGTVDVEFGNKTVTAYASKDEHGIRVFGFIGKYRTGTKLWPCAVWLYGKNTSFHFGFDSRSMTRRCYKSDVFFAPERFFNVGVAA